MMQRAIGTVSGTALLILLTSLPVLAQQAIIRGRSIGKVSLGMSRAEVWKHIGRPTEIHFLHLAGRTYLWDYWQNESSGKREIVTSRRGRVVQIERDVTDEERRQYLFPVVRGHHARLKVSLYTEYEDNGSTITADDVRQGVAWAVYIHHYKHNEFNTHLLSEIGPARVIVHRPGAKLLPNTGEIPDKTDSSLGDIRTWFAVQTHTRKN